MIFVLFCRYYHEKNLNNTDEVDAVIDELKYYKVCIKENQNAQLTSITNKF